MPGTVMVLTEDAQLGEELAQLITSAGLRHKSLDLAQRGTEPFQYGLLPSALLLDLALASVQAAGVLRVLAERYPELPIIVITAAASVDQVTTLFRLGASAMVVRTSLASGLSPTLTTLAQDTRARAPFRAAPRVSADLSVELALESGGMIEVHASRDLSRNGIFLRMEVPFDLGERVSLILRGAEGERIDLKGEVRRRVDSGLDAGNGIHFLDPSPEAQEQLARLLVCLARGETPKPALPDPPVQATAQAPPPIDPGPPPPPSKSMNLGDMLAEAATTDVQSPPMLDNEDLKIGERLMRIGSYALAQARFQKASEREPDNQRLLCLQALAGAREAARLNQHESATEYYRRALDIDTSCQEAIEALEREEQRQRKPGLFSKLFAKS